MNEEQIFMMAIVGIVCMIIGALVGAKSKTFQNLVNAAEATLR